MDTTVTLDASHSRMAADKARALGTTPEDYLHALIEADARSFDEILLPVREGFAGMSDDELEALLGRARSAARQTE
jgi:hypothetical protein